MNRPTECHCPHCQKPIEIDELKKIVPDEDVKTLWAALGGRKTRRRAISPEQQRKMQEARRSRKAEAPAQ